MRVAVAGGDHRVGRGAGAEPALEPQAVALGEPEDAVAEALVEVLHPDRALTLEQHQPGRADGVEVEEVRRIRGQLARGGVSMNPRIPSCRVSSAPAETSQTRSPSTGRSRSISARATRQPTAERLSLAPGTTRLRHMSPRTTALAAPSAIAGLRRPAAARQRRDDPGDRSRQRAPPLRRLRLDVRDHLREALVERGDGGLVEHEAGLGGVVVGEDDERARRVGLAQARDDVDRLALAPHRAPEDARPVLDLVHQPGQGQGRERPAEQAAPAQRERGAGGAERAQAWSRWAGRCPRWARPRARSPRRPRFGAVRRATPRPRARRASRAGARSPPGARSPRAASPRAARVSRWRGVGLGAHRARNPTDPRPAAERREASRYGTQLDARGSDAWRELGLDGFGADRGGPISVCALLSRPRIRNSVAITPSSPIPAPTMNASA